MNQDTYKILFTKLPVEHTPNDLFVNIETNVVRLNKRNSLIKGSGYALLTCVALAGCVFAFQSMVSTMGASGFSSYASILITDGTNIFGSWRELGMAMVESLPVLSITAVLALVVSSLFSFSKSFLYMRNARTMHV
jgi:hypothetical protein